MSRRDYFARLEIVLGYVLLAGVVASTGLLAAGLGLSMGEASVVGEMLLHAGLIALMATPVVRVIVACVEYAREGDWAFALASLAVLGVLAVTLTVALFEARK
jgi:hypothetical protein